MTPSPDPLVGEDMTDINMEDIERNNPVVIPPTQEQQQQQISSRTNHSAGGGGQSMKNRLKTLLILRTPQPVETTKHRTNQSIN